MQRKQFLQQSLMGAGALALFNNKSMAAMLQTDPWKIKPLRNDVSIFTEKGGTIAFLISKKSVVVVDAEFPEQAGHLIGEIKKQTTKPIELLMNTHHHGDHTAGNIAFKGLVSHVAAHANSLSNQQRVAVQQKSEDKQLYPDLTYTDTWEFKTGKEHIKSYYFGAGHTDGDSIIHFQNANIVHMGDLVFNRRWAYIDKTAGANIQSWVKVLDKTLSTFDNDTLFIFGHAFDPEKVTGNKDDLRAMQNYLTKLYDYVKGAIKAGKTKDEILKSTSIPGVTEWQGEGIERGLQAAYEEASKEIM